MHMASPARLTAHPVAAIPRSKPRARLPYCLHKEQNLFREGDPCSGLFEVVGGVFRLSRLTRGGRRHVVGFGFPGDILGYGPDTRHISDCDAITAARVIRHRPGILRDGSDPYLQEMLLTGALRRVEAMQDHCVMLGRNNARDRVAAFLALLADRMGKPRGQCMEFDLPMPRADIADYLGLTAETVSRSLTELRKAGLIEIANVHRIILPRAQVLDTMAAHEA